MRLKPSFKKVVIEIISLLYIVLFVYAAISKFLDFENFQVQIGQSPLLSAFAGIISPAVIIIELIISLLLAIPKRRILGLYLSFALMTMFTAYIFIILNFSSFIPCSCGGILENLGWTEHLIFNSSFIVLGLVAILIEGVTKTALYKTAILLFLSPLTVTLLYLRSEAIIRQENPFIRRYEMFAVSKKKTATLENASFYFAGSDAKNIYLGNHSAPLHLIAFDKELNKKRHYEITLDNDTLPFRSVEIRIAGPYFYIYDGLVPIVFRGKVGEWKAKTVYRGDAFFTQAVALDSTSLAIRGQYWKSGEHLLGKMSISESVNIHYNPAILEKQIDGIFDTDGTLRYSPELRKLVYTYYYRNEYIVADDKLSFLHRGHTVDTITKANLRIVKNKLSRDTKMSTPPLMVNKNTTVYANLLFVNASLRGRFEEKSVWDLAAIIDVYDYIDKQYKFSFYVYAEGKFMPKDFLATDQGLYTITNNILSRHVYGMPVYKVLHLQ
jgi:uncharacterized membrane protein YphA (DoxX/SURF4 family)